MQVKSIPFIVRKDEDCSCGSLIAIEENKDIPFHMKRVFFIYGVDSDVKRGAHAHRTSAQVLVCVHGSCTIVLDDGKEKQRVVLDSPDKGLLQEPLIWGEMEHFSKDAVLMVLSDSLYDPAEYIHSYEEFLELAKVAS